jgi:hypothetical protein
MRPKNTAMVSGAESEKRKAPVRRGIGSREGLPALLSPASQCPSLAGDCSASLCYTRHWLAPQIYTPISVACEACRRNSPPGFGSQAIQLEKLTQSQIEMNAKFLRANSGRAQRRTSLSAPSVSLRDARSPGQRNETGMRITSGSPSSTSGPRTSGPTAISRNRSAAAATANAGSSQRLMRRLADSEMRQR